MGFEEAIVRGSAVRPTLVVEAGPAATRLVIGGDWTIRTVGEVEARVREVLGTRPRGPIEIDLAGAGHVDTAGALLVDRMIAAVPEAERRIVGLDETRRVLFAEVADADLPPPAPAAKPTTIRRWLERLGELGVGFLDEAKAILTLLGGVAVVVVQTTLHPSRIRFVPFVHQLERTALNAAPIITLMSFLIGAIIAQQGAFYFRRFGADLYVVDMVGVLTLREIAVLLTAIMVAGRSGSSFTAELGSMKMREEVDALKVIGLDPVEVLVVPRLLALMLALPILTFLSDLAALFGAAIVCNTYGGIPTETFLMRLKEAIEMRTFWVGIAKAPFMALIIGLVASVEGLAVKGSAESLGTQTTQSVVKSIFMVIVVDGIFAMFYAAAGV
ncbi:ABC transporter permease [Pinisolibacter sp.]|uniref:ABC transporter permease n=1 Tax=Pinisolibacter sp. TaxID=2172024 RepID=UPI002FDEAEFE